MGITQGESRLTDADSRQIEYLRLSVTDRCNLRCLYCMPGECGFLPPEEFLSYGEMLYICSLLASMGIKKIKITGGEPLIREGITDFIAKLKEIPGISSVTLTTNGHMLKKFLPELKRAGIDGINISIDSLRPETYKKITGADGPRQVLEAAYASCEAGIRTKINFVAMESVNMDEVSDFALIAKNHPIDVRFIEVMPLGIGSSFKPVAGEQILETLNNTFGGAEPSCEARGNGPAVYYRIPGFLGHIGFINPISRCFCPQCNRIRITAYGRLQLCLAHPDGIGIKKLLRNGADRAEIAAHIASAVFNKPESHDFTGANFEGKESKMWRIGG